MHMNRWANEQARPGGAEHAATPASAGSTADPPAEPPSQAQQDAARAEQAELWLGLFLGVAMLLAVALPINFPQLFRGAPGPLRKIEAEGFHMRYTGPSYLKVRRMDYYIGAGPDGQCHVSGSLMNWDSGLCEIRLRQIRAGDCNAVPTYDDEHCRAMPLGAAPTRERSGTPAQAHAQAQAGLEPGAEPERRPVRILFLVREGETTTASELP